MFDPSTLEALVAAIVRALGADAEVSAEVARHLVRSNLSGHDSHGVLRVPQYAAQVERGEIDPGARPGFLRESSVTALVDARRSFAHFSTAFALDWTMTRAREHGLAAAAVRHSSHIGRLGEYTERAADAGLISIVTVGTGGPGVGGMVLHGGTKRFFGANPWSIGVPAAGGPPVVFDGSTSVIAEGKVRAALAKGEALPAGCIIDRDGRPTTDPADFYAGGALLPLGGALAGHKGYGLAMASLLLSALSMIDDAEPTLAGASVHQEEADHRGRMAGVVLVTIDPARFGNARSYQTMVRETAAAAKRVPPAPGVDEVLVPGELEGRTRARRLREGISLPRATWREIATVADTLGVRVPAGLIL